MDTSAWTYEKKQGAAKAVPSTIYEVPLGKGTTPIYCDHDGAFLIPTHLAAEVVEWLQRQELLEPAPDLQGRGSAPKGDE